MYSRSGELVGKKVDGVLVYKGAPYAAAPTGERRWRPPGPPPRWTGARDATAFAPDPVQSYSAAPSLDSGRSQAPGMSEDCLYLNVWTPDDARGADLPVLVWFPGGGFVRGSAAEPVYDGRSMARRGVVVVSVNYRLGAFGFLAHPALSRESSAGASGNYGLMDAIAALAWVRDNVAAFGGDPARVTIGGQSAGGAVVANLLVSPAARGLFTQAIAMSPGAFRPLGELGDAEACGLAAGEDIQALRALPAEAVLALNKAYIPKARGLTTPRMLRPIVDGWVLPEQETSLFLSGRFAPVPLMVGTVEDEGSMIAAGSQMSTRRDFEAFLKANFAAEAGDALALYPAASDTQAQAAYAQALSDSQFLYAARSLARVFAEVQPNTFRYHFTHRTGDRARPAQHCDDLMYAFGALGACAPALGLGQPGEAALALAETLQDAFARFIATGDPNGGAIRNWPRYEPGGDASLEFGDAIRVTRNLRRAQMDLLDRTYGLFQAPGASPAG